MIELIGKGGMGAVYKCRQKSLDRFVALKILPQSLAADESFALRFQAEAKALATLNHPNIVTIHDFGHQGGFYFLLMEFVDGLNLRHLICQGRELLGERGHNSLERHHHRMHLCELLEARIISLRQRLLLHQLLSRLRAEETPSSKENNQSDHWDFRPKHSR
ncbi:MAG: protein kinase [Akkermansiaceae bacterium]